MTPLAAIIAQRGRASVARSQGRAWLFCEEQVRVDPELRAERGAAKPMMPHRDYAELLEAIMARRGVDRDAAVRLIRDYRNKNGGSLKEAMEALARVERPAGGEVERLTAEIRALLVELSAHKTRAAEGERYRAALGEIRAIIAGEDEAGQVERIQAIARAALEGR